MAPLKVAIVGMGGIGNTHARVYQDNPLSEIVAVCDIIQERADAAAEAYGCPAFYSVQELLDSDVKIDCASMCTAGTENGGDHYEPTMQLLKAGIPTLGEKPISNDVKEAKKMVALAKRKKVRYGIDLNHRFTPAAIRAKGWIDEGRLGHLHMVNMKMWIPNPNESSPHFHMRALHPHSIDIMRYFCGDVKSVHAFFSHGRTIEGKKRKCWSNVQVNMLFKNGVVGHLCGSYDAGGGFGLEHCEVTGSKGRFVIEEACQDLYFNNRVNTEFEHYHNLDGMTHFNETFASRINKWLEQNQEKVSPGKIDGAAEDALKAQKIIEAAITSWDEKRIVNVR